MSIFLDALNCRNYSGRPPVWLMRQAGRYMPEYRALRERYSLHHLFHTPELAAEVTLQPVKKFGVDAAIVFSDILVVPEMLGFTVHFPEGQSPFLEPKDFRIENLNVRPAREVLRYVADTIQFVKPQLAIPLIGFCGGPYTVASYILGREKTLQYPQLHPLLEKITEATVDYLKMQVESGAQAIQIFDSWAGLLPPEQFAEFSVRYLEKIIASVSVPVILFTRGASSYVSELSALNPSAISFDGGKSMEQLRRETPHTIAVQGNLEPEVLLTSIEEIQEKTQALLTSMDKEPGFIVNLGHGVLRQTPVEHVQAFVETVHNWAPASA